MLLINKYNINDAAVISVINFIIPPIFPFSLKLK